MTYPLVGLTPASTRRTPAHWVYLFGVNILFSYQTPVAFTYPGKVAARRDNIWGPTTGRHLKETGCDGYKLIREGVEFNELLNRTILEAVAARAAHALEVGHALA